MTELRDDTTRKNENQTTVKPRGASTSTSMQVTSLTCACGGPCHSQAHSASTAAVLPQTNNSTRPSARLRASPLTPNSRALCCAAARYATPCTLPVTKQRLHVGMRPPYAV